MTKISSQKGRPPCGSEKKLWNSLLVATEHELHEKSHLDLTSREIAETAGTYAPMINYYFQGKEGLFLALIGKVDAEIDLCLRKIEADIGTHTKNPTEYIVRALVETYAPHASVVSAVLIENHRVNSQIREQYSRRRCSIFDRVEALLTKLVARGDYRKDLDITAGSWLIVSLVIGPLVLRPSWQATKGPSRAPDTETWIEHVVRMLNCEFSEVV